MTTVRNDVLNDCLLTPAEVARILRKDVVTLWRWRKDGKGPAWIRVETRVMYWLSAVLRYADDGLE